jgi:orotate phosphoribosyltransferase
MTTPAQISHSAAGAKRPSLFQIGDFTLASGKSSLWKIECDGLTDEDWDCLAMLGWAKVPDFGSVVGVPRGGLKFAKAMEDYATAGPRLVVDDVFTTGESIRKVMRDGDLALVAFNRATTPPPSWLYSIWSLT